MKDANREVLMESFLTSMLQSAEDIIVVKDQDLTYVGVSQSFIELVGAKDETEVIGKEDSELFKDKTVVKHFKETDQRVFATGKALKGEIEPTRTASGEIKYFHTAKFPLFHADGSVVALYAISKDVTSEYKAKAQYEHELQELSYAAEWDQLTDVYNREATNKYIRRFLEGQGSAGSHWLFMIDIDNFKMVNDTFGHRTGDEILTSIAESIRKVFRETDIVGRIGGDEFFALAKDMRAKSKVARCARRLLETLQYICSEDGENIELSASVGISHYNEVGKTLEQLYSEADMALYRAKEAGKNRFVLAEESGLGDYETSLEEQPINAVHLRTLLGNMDAVMFQTELSQEGEITIAYSSHNMFLEQDSNDIKLGTRGENFWEVILEEDLEAFKESIVCATREEVILDCTCRVKSDVGQTQWRHIRGMLLSDEGDGISRMIHVATDITQQKVIEAELREKDRIIDFAMHNTDVNIWYFDYETAECTLTKSCQKAHEMVAVEKLDRFPECLFDMNYVREDSIEPLRKVYQEIKRTGKSQEIDVWFRKADGTGWWCERDMISPLKGGDGKVTRAIGIGKNITVEKEMEEKFHVFQSYQSLAQNNTLVTVRMNLTTGWCGDFANHNSVKLDIAQVNSVDEFLGAINLSDVQEGTKAAKPFTRTSLLDAFSSGKTSIRHEGRSNMGDVSPIWIRAIADMMKNPATGDIEALYYIFDIDYEKNMEFVVERLLSDDYEFLGLINVITGRIMVFGEDARNGGNYEDEKEKTFQKLMLEEYYKESIRTMGYEYVMKELESKEYYICSFPTNSIGDTKTGRKQWKFSYLDDTKSKILMTRTDITSIYTAERDPLTGLYNRETFYRRAREVLDTNLEVPFIILRFDIDRFKAYNDAYGTQAGDQILAEIGRAARQTAWPKRSVFGRLDADHFVALLPVDEFDLSGWHEQQMQVFDTVAIGYHLTSSTGVYQIKDKSMEVSLMCDRALLALRTAKDSYTHKLAWYDESLRDQLMHEQAMADDMKPALLQGEFEVYYQPIVNYDSGEIIGAEALVRWNHSKHGMLLPGAFIPLFEKNGFILKLDAYVWEQSCLCLNNWISNSAICPVPISVNISRYDLYDPEICEKLQSLVQQYHIPFSMLKLEITESAYMEDPEQLIGMVSRFRAMGFAVNMDDFGAGFSSLNMLKDVPVDTLKLDTQFLSKSDNGQRATTILSSIIHMAHELGLSVIAEGVETKEQAEYLKGLKCSQMQGYYFGRPMTSEKFEALLLADTQKGSKTS